MRQRVSHPTIGEIELPGSPMHFSETPATVCRHPPELGEHSREILADHGFDAAAIDRLFEEGVVE